MTPDEYTLDDLARMDTEILIATRIAEQAENAASVARHRAMCLRSLRLNRSIGGLGTWERDGEHHALTPTRLKGGFRLHAALSLYTGGTHQWRLDLLQDRRGKRNFIATAQGDTPRIALKALHPSDGAAARWLDEVHKAALDWDEFNRESAERLGLLRRRTGY